MYNLNGEVYTIDNMMDFVDRAILGTKTRYVYKGLNGCNSYTVFECPCAFDTEATSEIVNGVKVGYLYIWQFGINGYVIYGRTLEEFVKFYKYLVDRLGLSSKRRLLVYVHFLSYDFQFIRKLFGWEQVFSIDMRKPIYARTEEGVEFRCSNMLTATGLEKVGETLTKYKVNKLVGGLDYSLKRHSGTPLTDRELEYCYDDVRVIMAHIQECIEAEGSITKIPYTLTGYVRRDVRNAVLKDKRVAEFIQSLKLTREEYEMWKEAFQGGFTHANIRHSGITQYDVVSYDFTSSYPTVMIAEKFPMSNGIKIDVEQLTYEQFMEYIRTKCCLMTIEFTGMKLKENRGDCPLSESKCIHDGKIVVDNGRVRSADRVITTITEQDYITYRKFYDIEDFSIHTMYVYEKGYLPKPIIEKCLSYYYEKTQLKGVEDKKAEYQLAKTNVCSIFGMMVMSIERLILEYHDDWEDPIEPDVDKVLEKYNDDDRRFNWFPWGVYITAYARKNLFTGIYECDNDYIYSDTDSIKILNAEKHEDYILEYNRQVTEKLEACLDHYRLDKALLSPKTVEGVVKPLGVWDFDGHYKRFKTLGAKKYLVETDDGKIKSTIAGVGKKAGAEYLSQFENPFDKFEDGLEFPSDRTGKKTHIYVDDEHIFDTVDYLGNKATVRTLSGIYLEDAPFTIGLSDAYRELLMELQMGYDDDIVK